MAEGKGQRAQGKEMRAVNRERNTSYRAKCAGQSAQGTLRSVNKLLYCLEEEDIN
jgi:hypothetical protein